MRVALASGKGGAGKTFVSVHLAYLLAKDVTLIDCDVEEPNVSLYLEPRAVTEKRVEVLIPKVDQETCIDSSYYASICEFHALIPLKGKLLVYPHACHSCSACWTLSHGGEITPAALEIGTVRTYRYDGIAVTEGRIDEGSIATVPMIQETKRIGVSSFTENRYTLIDSPPGTSCAAIEAVRHSDLTIVVTEDTPFGIHDARLLIDTLRLLAIPFAAVINKYRQAKSPADSFCLEEHIPVIARIPFSRAIAEAYGGGDFAFSADGNLSAQIGRIAGYIRGRSL